MPRGDAEGHCSKYPIPGNKLLALVKFPVIGKIFVQELGKIPCITFIQGLSIISRKILVQGPWYNSLNICLEWLVKFPGKY